MRKLSSTLVAAMLFTTGSIFASKFGIERKPINSLSEQIGKMLENNTFSSVDGGKTAEIIFILNNEKEIVVLDVNGADPSLDAFIKTRLNYHEVQMSSFEPGKKYTLQVRIEA